MFNEELCKVYDANTIKELRVWAVAMEAQGRHVLLGLPATLVPGMVFPKAVCIENFQWSDFDIVWEMCNRITKDRPFIEDDYEMMHACPYDTINHISGGGLELWVK